MTAAVWGITMVRDEADIVAFTIQHMARQNLDGILVADNMSKDSTPEILGSLRDKIPCELVVIEDPEVGYFQSKKMSRLAHHVGEAYDADWVVPFDADEQWVAAEGTVGSTLRGLPDAITYAPATLHNYVPTAQDDEHEPNPFRRIKWRIRERSPLPKVACRFIPGMVIEQGNHGVKYPPGDRARAQANLLRVKHFPWRSFEQYARKCKNGREAYRATDLPDAMGLHWRGDGALLEKHGEDALREKWERWFWSSDPDANPDLIIHKDS